jgi:hypothetical protein
MRFAKIGVISGTVRRITATHTERKWSARANSPYAEDQLQPPCINVPSVFDQTITSADIQQKIHKV